MRSTVARKVRKFHKKFGVKSSPVPDLGSFELQDLRLSLVEEEVMELREAIYSDDLVEVADALGDILYVVYGAADVFGIPLDKVVKEIHRSNMSKLENGKPIYREDGKVLKGSKFFPPNLSRVLGLG